MSQEQPPVDAAVDRDPDARLEDGIALCLSGGGYRAMLFHAGALIRLNEMGVLPRIARFSSVSGGSISAAKLALAWPRLAFDARGVSPRLFDLVIDPLRGMASRTIDASSVAVGALWFGSVGDRLAGAYDKHLFEGATLQDLPGAPRFVFNATNVQSKALWRFSKPYMRDWRVGEVRNPDLRLAVAVAASSAFPPFLSPVEIEVDPRSFTPGSGADLQRPPYTSNIILTDGGVYDNLGLETAWKRYRTLWVSDGGGGYDDEPDPKRDWAHHSLRVLSLIDNQVRSLRKRQLMAAFKSKERAGRYWSAFDDIAGLPCPDKLPCDFEPAAGLARVATRLKSMEPELQERLMNLGYAICDASLRSFDDPVTGAPPPKFPFDRGV